MKFIFLIKSETVDIEKYTIKDLPGASGRLDVIIRCILSAILSYDSFEKNTQVWIFLDKYGTFLFDSEILDYETFPKNELKLADFFVELIRNKTTLDSIPDNPLLSVKIIDIDFFGVVENFINDDYKIHIMDENGEDFFNNLENFRSDKNVYIIGNQTGDFLNSKEILELNLPRISLGTQAYLGSSIIRLIKLNLAIKK